MKKLFVQITKLFLFFILLLGFTLTSRGQGKTCIDSLLMNEEYASEIPLIEKMRNEGKTDRQIYDFLEEKAKQHWKETMEYHPEIQLQKNTSGQIVNVTACAADSMGIIDGTFGIWKGETRGWSSSTGQCPNTPWVTASLPVPGRITIVSTPSNDPCADVAGFPIQLPSPYGGSHSIKLGNITVGGQSERLTYKFTVGPSDVNFVYQYAVVLNDNGHTPSQQPFFDFYILDKNGDTIPCSHQKYVTKTGLQGFQTSKKSNPACVSNGVAVYYRPWTLVGVNLFSYLGEEVTIVCTTADCSPCGHFGYTYLDFTCGATVTSQHCLGEDSVMLVAPYDPAFSYLWSSGQTTSSIVANPQLTTTVTVHITQALSPCGFDLGFVLAPTIMNPAISYSVDCATGFVNVKDSSTVTGGTLSAWNWQFPGGIPSSSTLRDPLGQIAYPPGTYTISLTTTSQAGCTKTISQPLTINALPVAQFNFSPHISCEGVDVNFTESSQNATALQWDFGDGSNSSQQNPTHFYPQYGTYTVTLIATNPPCRDTLESPLVLSYILDSLTPANVFTPNDDGINDCFKPVFFGNVGDTLLRCIEMKIFDRWGVKVFESEGDAVCWDGKTPSKAKANEGTYYYLIKLGDYTYKGYVTLARGEK